MRKGLVIRTNYSNTVPLTHVYMDLGIQPSPEVVLKPVKNGVLIITRSSSMMKAMSMRIKGTRIVSFYTIDEFYRKIIKNISLCENVEVQNVSPIIIRSDALLKIINSLRTIKSLQLRIVNNKVVDLKMVLEPDNGSLRRITMITIFGIGLFRELGYGAINTKCVN